MISTIYKIIVRRENKPELSYIGQAIDFDRRTKDHKKSLKNGHHENSALRNLFAKYGEEAFEFKPLILCLSDQATFYEQLILDAEILRSGRHVLNIRRICVASHAGRKFSASARANMSAAKRGRPGWKWTEEQKASLSLKKKGIAPSPEQCAAHSIKMTGRKASDLTRKKMSESQRKRRHPPETIERIRLAALRREEAKRSKRDASADSA